ncbi:MAG: glycosyltransferase [Acidimicrobiales bacterium]
MRSRLRLFVLVGLAASVVDFGLLALLAHRGVVPADLVALAAASLTSYLGNRVITFRGDPRARWVRRPSLFAVVAMVAGLVDLAVLSGLVAMGLPLIPAKAAAVLVAAVIRWTAYRRVLFAEVRRELSQRRPRTPVTGDVRLTVVIPAYHEAERIAATVAAVTEAVTAPPPDGGPGVDPDELEIIVVDDGSGDETAVRAAAAGATVVEQPVNRGKGAAVRAGVLAARGRTVVFTDADLAYPPELILDVLTAVEDGWDVVVGSRRHTATNTLVRARRVRELGGRVINLLTHLVLLGAFHDTQCGIKGFRRDVGVAVFERGRIDGFAFDVELFLMAEQDRLSLTEIPVSVRNRPGSSVSVVGDSLVVLRDLFRIRRWAGAGAYRPNDEQRAVVVDTVTRED